MKIGDWLWVQGKLVQVCGLDGRYFVVDAKGKKTAYPLKKEEGNVVQK